MARHRLDPTLSTVTDVFSRDLRPVLPVVPDDTLVVRSLDVSGYLARPAVRGERPPRLLPGASGHYLTATELVIGVQDARPVPGVHAETPGGRNTFGFDADLSTAAADALDGMLTWMQVLHDVDRTTALALASTVVDLRITQVANRTRGVHAVLAHGALER